MRICDGGYFKRTHIYTLKMTSLLKVLQGKAGRGSKVDICPALACCFSISKWLMGYLLPVLLPVFLFFANLIFSQKIIFHVCWLGFWNTIKFYLVFFLRKLFLLIRVRPWKPHFPLYTSLKITRKCFVFHNWIFRWWYRLCNLNPICMSWSKYSN